jgi:AcrR family transcriptional regulator
MNMAARRHTRSYVSPVRDQRAEATRSAIVRAAAGVLSQQPPDLRMPAVAHAARVGVATVYRHFGSKDELLDAVYDHWMQGARRILETAPTDREGRLELLSALWHEQAADEELERAMSIYNPAGRSARRRRLARRRQLATDFVADVDTGDDQSQRYLQAIALLLTSTTAHRHLCDHWDLTTEEAASAAAWGVRKLIAGARDQERPFAR